MQSHQRIKRFITRCQVAALLVSISACGSSGTASVEEAQSAIPQNPVAAQDLSLTQNQNLIQNQAQSQNSATMADQTFTQSESTGPTSFQPNSTFNSQIVGVSITMPNDVTAQFNQRTGTLAFSNNQNTVGGLIAGGTSGGLAAGEGRVIHSILGDLGLTVQQVFSEVVVQGVSLSTVFHVKNANEVDFLMQLEVRAGNAGNYILVLANSMFDQEMQLNSVASQLASNTVFSNPQTPTLALDLRGSTLELQDSSNTTFEGSGNLTGGSESMLLICDDGRYAFASQDSTFISFDNNFGSDISSVSTNDSIQHGGFFTTHVDLVGNQLMELRSQTQGVFVFNLTAVNGSIFIDTDGYTQTSAMQSPDCLR